MDQKTHSIGNVTAGAIITTAIIIDGIQFLLTLTVVGTVVASFITVIAGFSFWLWFALLGVKYLGKDGGRKALIALSSVVAELVPFISAIPATTAGVVGIIITERIREAKERNQQPDARKAAAIARLARMKAAWSNLLESGRVARVAQEQARHGNPDEEA